MASSGMVRTYHPDEGWGILDGADVPGGCWVHFSAIMMDGFRKLTAGQRVSFLAEVAAQDGLAYRAVKVWTGDTEPADHPRQGTESAAFRSTLTLTFDEPPEHRRR